MMQSAQPTTIREVQAQYETAKRGRLAVCYELEEALNTLVSKTRDDGIGVVRDARELLNRLAGSGTTRDDERTVAVLLDVNRDVSKRSKRLSDAVRRLEEHYEIHARLMKECLLRVQDASSVVGEITAAKNMLEPEQQARLIALAIQSPEIASQLLRVTLHNAKVRQASQAALDDSFQVRTKTLERWLDQSSEEHPEVEGLRRELAAVINRVVTGSSGPTGPAWPERHAELDSLMRRASRFAFGTTRSSIHKACDRIFRRLAGQLGRGPGSLGMTRDQVRRAKRGLDQLRAPSRNGDGVIKSELTEDFAVLWLSYRERLTMNASETPPPRE